MSTVRFKGRTLVLLKPSTFMNSAAKPFGTDDAENPLDHAVVTDDLNLPLGPSDCAPRGATAATMG